MIVTLRTQDHLHMHYDEPHHHFIHVLGSTLDGMRPVMVSLAASRDSSHTGSRGALMHILINFGLVVELI
jgi:hypothetical protein